MAGMYPLCMIDGSSSSRFSTASKPASSKRPCGTTEREGHRIRRTSVVHRTDSAAEIRAAVDTTVTQRSA
ncbi:hypothetical protein TNCV_1218071 [Trichonephila clavipes]|nr:hypothetical protein TNCV_1218071 [Trichonephila clavipes]